ncbi:MAG TPA: PIG-L family deacetylase, partial [Pirellulales bacterium]|nr:PIG-L family deacetylase [Pirellulales bacterium]
AEATGDLAAVREREMAAAAGLVPAELFMCGVPDGEAADTPRQRKRLIEVYRRFRPTLVLAHSPRDYHPDHRASARLADAASWFAASRGHVTASVPLDEPPQLWRMDCINRGAFRPHFYIDVSDYAELKRRMLTCHKSQLAREADADFTPLAQLLDLQMKARGAEAQTTAAEAFQIHHVLKRVRAW